MTSRPRAFFGRNSPSETQSERWAALAEILSDEAFVLLAKLSGKLDDQAPERGRIAQAAGVEAHLLCHQGRSRTCRSIVEGTVIAQASSVDDRTI
jgi:hypothetical protein